MKILSKIKETVLLNGLIVSPKSRIKTYLILSLILITLLGKRWLPQNFITTSLDLILTFLLLYIILHMTKIMILSGYRRRNKFKEEHYDNLTIGISYLMTILHLIIFTIYLFYYFHVDIISLLTVMGLFFAGLAWLLKDYFVNVMNGLILMFSKNLMIGNYVLVNGYKGIIRNITFLYTIIRTDEGNLMYVPNSSILSNEVLNYSQARTKNIVFNFDLPVKHFNKIDQLTQEISKKLQDEYPELVKDFDMRIGKIKTKSANIIYQVTLKKYTFKIEKEVTNFIKQNILEYMYTHQEKENRISQSIPKGQEI